MIAEIRQTLRSLARSPGLALAAVLTLALGTGSTIAIGTIVYSILWRPLPGVNAGRLVLVYPTDRGALDAESDALTLAEAEEIAASGAVDELAVLMFRNLTLTGGEPERVLGTSVSPDFFRVLGVSLLLGRDFRADEGRPIGREESVVLSHVLWQRRFGGDPAAVGSALEMNQRRLVVAGVLPPGFGIPGSQQLYLPWAPESDFPRDARDFWTVATLPGNAPLSDAQNSLDAAAERLRAGGVVDEAQRGFRLVPIRESLYDPHTTRILAVLSTLVFAVLVVACFNVANLLVARAAAREGELAVRLALGAGRGRILRQVLGESFLLAVAGCAAGLLLGKWGLDVALATMNEEFPAWMTFELDARLVAGACALAGVVTLLAGLAPALGAGRSGLLPLLAAAGRSGDSRRTRRFQRLLVGLQFAASFVVLVGGIWLLGSVRALEHADLGFAPGPLLSFRTYLPGDAYDPPARRVEFRERLVERLAATPGVAGAAVTTALPADDGGDTERASRAEDAPSVDASLVISLIGVSRGFFATLGAPLVAGETWSAAEDAGASIERVVVNRALATRLWPGEPTLGKRLRLGLAPDAPVYTIAGIAPDLPFEELHEQTERAALQVFVPFARFPWRSSFVVVRAAGGDPAALAETARGALAKLEPDAPLYDVMTYPARLRQSWEDRRLIGNLATVFAAQGLVLAAVGLFGVLAYSVARRTRELGLRMALGAAPRAVVLGLVRDGFVHVVPGAALGLLLALAAARGIRGVLYGVDPLSPLPFVIGLATLVAVAALASGLAARRAAAVDPVAALRDK